MKSKLKSLLILFLISVAVIELLELGFNLMNYANDLVFYIGAFIVGVLLFIGGYWFGKELYDLYLKIKNPKE